LTISPFITSNQPKPVNKWFVTPIRQDQRRFSPVNSLHTRVSFIPSKVLDHPSIVYYVNIIEEGYNDLVYINVTLIHTKLRFILYTLFDLIRNMNIGVLIFVGKFSSTQATSSASENDGILTSRLLAHVHLDSPPHEIIISISG